MKLTALCLAASVSLAIAEEFTLNARPISSDQSFQLGIFDYEIKPLSVSQVSPAKGELPSDTAYCVDATFEQSGTTIPCFSYLELQYPFKYSLIIDLHDEEISKLSLVYNSGVEGIVPTIRRPVNGPEAPPFKLKKVTKTYKDKKAAKDAATAQFKDEEDVDDRSWMQKNWKMLLIGLVVYNIIAFGSRQQQRQQAD